MTNESGKCPGCDSLGVVGQPCTERGCKKSGLHFIDESFWEQAHPEGGEGPDRFIGQMVGDFLIVSLVGAGGFGRVYLALQTPLLQLKGALKLVEFSTDDPELTKALLEKFEGEAQALAQLSHPNIVRLLKYGAHGDRPYLVMEYVEGHRSLRDELYLRTENGRGFSAEEIIHILGQVLNGLSAAHEQDIVHRDIKPENIMLQTVVGNDHYVRLLDFGLAKFVARTSDTRWHLGSPSYMAPEQISRKNLGPWTDLYAVAVMAYEMLSGKRPFPGATDNEVLIKKVKTDYDPIEQLVEMEFPQPVLDFLGRGLEREPEDRYQSASEFHEEFIAAVNSMADRLGATGAVLEAGTRPLKSADLLEVFRPADVDQDSPTIVRVPTDEELESSQPSENLDGETRKVDSEEISEEIGEEISEELPGRKGRFRGLMAVLVVALVVGLVVMGQSFSGDNAEEAALAAVTDEVHVLDHEEHVDAGEVEDASLRLGQNTSDAIDAAKADAAEDVEEGSKEDRLILEMALGKFHTCLLLRGGDVRCWGVNSDAELGLGHTQSIGGSEPASTAPFVRLGEPAIQIVAAGDREASFTCALLESKNVRCWGSNHFGQLGYGHTRRIGENEHPEEVGYVPLGGPVQQLAAGAMQYATHACAIFEEDGNVRCWGNNRYGQLGYGHTNHIGDSQLPASFDPIEIGGPAAQISAGKFHTCALLKKGDLRCWGRNNQGQLGYGHTDNVGDTESPASVDPVDVGAEIMQISLGRQHSCARLEEGRVRCWGWNRNGQLGYGHTRDVGATDAPWSFGDVDVGAPVTHISAGGLHTCALLEEGRVRCWGDNRFGQLGYGHRRTVGDEGPPSAAGDVNLGGRAVALEAANYHTCAVLEDDTLRCWGLNQFGQLGYGHEDNVGHRTTPAAAGPVPFQ